MQLCNASIWRLILRGCISEPKLHYITSLRTCCCFRGMVSQHGPANTGKKFLSRLRILPDVSCVCRGVSLHSPSSPCRLLLRPRLVPAIRRDATDMSLLKLHPAPLCIRSTALKRRPLDGGDTGRCLSTAGANEQRACTGTGTSSQGVYQARSTATDLRRRILTQWGR
jgi:hypothetical protein